MAGRLRIEDRAFVDDTGPRLPVFCHYGDALSKWLRGRDDVRQTLATIAGAGYQGIRVWDALASPGEAFWRNREVGPRHTPDYYEEYEVFLRAVDDAGLKVIDSRGNLTEFGLNTTEGRKEHMRRVAEIHRRVGLEVIAYVDVNEPDQIGEPNPARVRAFVDEYRRENPGVLTTLGDGGRTERRDDINRWSQGQDLWTVHGRRHGPIHERLQSIFSVSYQEQPRLRLGFQDEPTGPGAPVSGQRESDVEALVSMALMAPIARQGWVYFSGQGIHSDGRFEGTAGFAEVPRAVALLEAFAPDLMRYEILAHGGRRDLPIVMTSGDNFRQHGRVDQAVSPSRRKAVALVYGGTRRIMPLRAMHLQVINPATLDVDYEGPAREMTLDFRVARLLLMDW